MVTTLYARNRKEWRDWLEKHHDTENIVYLIKYKKHTNKPSLSHKESMEEAICFGWIDTTIKRLDDERYTRCFRRRTDNSRWSRATLRYAQELIAEGKMTAAGLKRYQEGLRKPTIDHNLPKNPEIPEDLKVGLHKNKKAEQYFQTLAPSYRRYYIYWLMKAKRAETRKKRIESIVSRCAQGKKTVI